eukprot:INCI4997.10.p1 GENE.INCI4997.10~~INCI4997.10.p1  ORF type:complete len:696 (-),score=96.92 INCI4997.10:2543-4513(-)
MTQGLELLGVRANIGTVRADHGMQVHFRGRGSSGVGSDPGCISREAMCSALKASSKAILTLDFMGPWARALNPVLATTARWFFPFQLGSKSLRSFSVSSESGSWILSGNIGLGMKRLSKATIMKSLQDQIDGGDPVLVLRVSLVSDGSTHVLFDVPTKCSLIRAALESGGGDVIFDGMVPDYTPSRGCLFCRRGLLLARWSLMPLLFLALVVAIGYLPWTLPWIEAFTPDLFSNRPPAGSNNSNENSLVELLLPDPRAKSEAFRLGQLEEKLSLAEANAEQGNRGDVIDTILRTAAEVIGRSAVSAAELHGTLKYLELKESEGATLAERAWGFLSFVNLVWALSIIGISVSIGPAIYHLLKPLRELLKRFITWITVHILIPLAKQCHQRGVFEVLAWIGCGQLLANGIYHTNPAVHLYFALTATGLSIPAAAYTTLLHGPTFIRRRLVAQIGQLYFVAITAMLAVHHQSSMFGFACIGTFYGFLGFHSACGGMCWLIGFESKDATVRSAVASAVLLCGFLGARMFAIDSALLRPFTSAVSILGSNVLFLALLIIASKWTYRRPSTRHLGYAARNLLMVAALVTSGLCGFVWGLPGLANTAIVYAVLWGMEKYVELHREMKWNAWLLILVLSAILWRGSLYVHAHPALLVSMMHVFG